MSEEKEKVLLEWAIHLARRQPVKAMITIFAIFLASLIVLVALHNPLLALLTVLLLFASAGEFLFPIHYRLTESGAQMRNFLSVRTLPWGQVRHCYRGREGIKLSPLQRRTTLEAFRGIHLRAEGNLQEEVVELIRTLRPTACAPTEMEK